MTLLAHIGHKISETIHDLKRTTDLFLPCLANKWIIVVSCIQTSIENPYKVGNLTICFNWFDAIDCKSHKGIHQFNSRTPGSLWTYLHLVSREVEGPQLFRGLHAIPFQRWGPSDSNREILTVSYNLLSLIDLVSVKIDMVC